MQRKNNILNTTPYIAKRNGIAMIMAITVIVIIGTIMALSLSLTSITAKRTTDLYLYEQSVLLSKSATEYAILRISQTAGCLNAIPDFTAIDGLYTISIDLKYIGVAASGCTDYINNLATPEQDGSVLMDIAVTTNAGTEPIRYFRRTIQKL
ncbi:hypothetical protein JHD46_07725 [Sulfurimonas sp. SAG-AH-194-C20]|nr:hypothetical protein [Sulfurimonas sp. SAG-AH-194-C20]MDF1879521.1 hypothetical protein [Sulfurimonas sp. SAG-AH-194-C20]